MKKIILLIGLLMTVQAKAGMTGSVDFKTLTPPSSPNTFLMCPKDYCKATPQEISPEYPVDAHALYETWAKMIKSRVRTKLVHADPDLQQYQYVQRSRIFRFPDYINVQFIPLGEKRATLAIYSRSKYGYGDMGVNRKRVLRWLAELNKLIQPSQR